MDYLFWAITGDNSTAAKQRSAEKICKVLQADAYSDAHSNPR
jgi:hypothetical protein